MELKKLLQKIDEKQDELYALLGSLVKIDSQNLGNGGNEEALARAVKKYCEDLDLETDFYSPLELEGFEEHPDYWPGHHLENRYNVTARWQGRENRDVLMLMGHSDTVPVGDRSQWKFDPLSGEVKDGKILGRGACDDKYALAASMFLIKLLKEEGFEPKANLLFSAYCDEEFGGSNGALAACLRYPAERIVNMDCKCFQIWHCASGGGEISYHYHTEKPADSADYTAKGIPIVMAEMDAFRARRKQELSVNPYYAGTIIPDTALRYLRIMAGLSTVDMGQGLVHAVFYTDKSREEIEEELRGMDERLKKALKEVGIIGDGFEHDTRFFHYGAAKPDCDAIGDMVACGKELDQDILVCGSCLSDLSVILKYGNPEAYAFGIGRDFNADGGAHQPNEFMTCEDLLKYTKIIASYILKTLG